MLTETVVVTWVVMLILVLACRFMTAHLEVHPTKKRQVIAEWIVTSIRDMVQTNMGEKYVHTWYVPFIGAMFALSAGCSLSSVVGAYAPTSDLSTVLGWALFVFALITITKIKTNGFGGYLLGFTTPLIYGGLSALSSLVLGLLPGAFGDAVSQIPIFDFGIPAILSLYFDFFSSVLQAFIFCMLTMMYIGGAAETDG